MCDETLKFMDTTVTILCNMLSHTVPNTIVLK